MFEITHFARLRAIFEVTLVDQFQNPAKIRHDKRMTHHFGESEQWIEQSQKCEWKSHEEEMWIRCVEDLKQSCRKIVIFKDLMIL